MNTDLIDLMVEGGTIGANLSLEHPSPRLQKVMRKNQDIEKFHDNVQYITSTYPFFVLGLNAMHGFPHGNRRRGISDVKLYKKNKVDTLSLSVYGENISRHRTGNICP